MASGPPLAVDGASRSWAMGFLLPLTFHQTGRVFPAMQQAPGARRAGDPKAPEKVDARRRNESVSGHQGRSSPEIRPRPTVLARTYQRNWDGTRFGAERHQNVSRA